MKKAPKHCAFPGQEEDEIVQVIIYKHIFSVLLVLLVSGGLFIGGLLLLYYTAAGGSAGLSAGLSSMNDSSEFTLPLLPISFIAMGAGLVLLLGALYIWRQNQMILTNENIVDMDQVGIFSRTISTLRLSRVQDVSVAVKGPMQTIFGYGTINIETAGEKNLFEFDYVPRPYDVKAKVQDLFEKFVEDQPHDHDGVLSPAETNQPKPPVETAP